MLDFVSKRGLFYLGVFLTLSATIVSAQIDQDIYYRYCVATPDTECFEPVSGAVDTVGRDVYALTGGYRFCLEIDSVYDGVAPIRVVLAIDASMSMCEDFTQCCEAGDGSGKCAKNDPDNMRIEAAHAFVDSLHAVSPNSEVGIVIYGQSIFNSLAMLSLDNDDNLQAIHDIIDEGSCDGQRTLGKTTRTTATKATNLGNALSGSLDVVDGDYSAEYDTGRHIILLTDGAWDDVDILHPDTLFDKYEAEFPDRSLPYVHGVFMSDSATHVAHGYPANGCSMGNGGSVPVELEYLEHAAQRSGGKYFPGSTPETVVETFQTILGEIQVAAPSTFEGMTVTNLTNGESRSHTSIETISESIETEVHYEATIDNLPLEFGANTIVVEQTITEPGGDGSTVISDTVTIFRTQEWTSTVNPEEYAIYCTDDSTTISITVTPEMRFLNDTFTVNSTVILKDGFILDSVDVRIFKFSDTDANTVAVYHLDENLSNSAADNEGTGAALVYTTDDMLFGTGALSSGSFSATIGNLSDDFAFEMWINPTRSTSATELFSLGGFIFGIDNELKPVVTVDGSEFLRSEVALEISTWSHIAVSRISGSIILSINGLTVSEFAEFTSSLTGAATMACPANATVDEIRISNASRLNSEAFADAIRFEIPTLADPTWILNGISLTRSVLTLAPEDWTDGSTTFNFTSPVDGRLVVNFQHKGTSLETIWSKNGNPVLVAADLEGPYITYAILTPGEITSLEDNLQIFFSEPVLCDSLKKIKDPAQSFKVYEFVSDTSENGTVTTVSRVKDSVFIGSRYETEECMEERITEVTLFVTTRNLGGIVPLLDSIKLFGTAIDTFGNYPDTTKFGEIRYGPGNGIEIAALPGDPDIPMQVTAEVKTRLGIKEDVAKIVMIQTRAPLVAVDTQVVDGEQVFNYSYKTIIYDAVANVVASDLIIRQSAQSDRMYYVVWPGLNRSRRRVSSGVYLLKTMVKYQNESDKSVPLQTKFSLKWRGN